MRQCLSRVLGGTTETAVAVEVQLLGVAAGDGWWACACAWRGCGQCSDALGGAVHGDGCASGASVVSGKSSGAVLRGGDLFAAGRCASYSSSFIHGMVLSSRLAGVVKSGGAFVSA